MVRVELDEKVIVTLPRALSKIKLLPNIGPPSAAAPVILYSPSVSLK